MTLLERAAALNPVALHREEDLKQTFSILHYDLLCRERVILNYQNQSPSLYRVLCAKFSQHLAQWFWKR